MDKKEPIVSIIVPVYNAEKTIRKCVESLLCQSFRDIEIICVNDCSKDNSQIILEEYAERDERIRIIKHTENKNAGGARNSGIKAANGQYLCFVDNDDWLAPNAIEMLYNRALESSGDYVVCDICEYYSNNCQNIVSYCDDSLTKEEIEIQAYLHGFPLLGALIKRSIFIDNSIYYPEKLFFEDNAISFCVICSASKIVAVHKPLYFYFFVPDSVSRSSSPKKIEDRIVSTDMFKNSLKERGLIRGYNAEYVSYYYIKLSIQTIRMCLHIPFYKAYRYVRDVSNRINSHKGDIHNISFSKEEKKYVNFTFSYFTYLYLRLQLGILRRKFL